MKLFKDNIPPPAGITPEEWEERKRKLKRKAWKRLALLMLVTVFLGEYIILLHGGYETLQSKRLDELQVRSGVCFYGFSRRVDTGIENPATGESMFIDRILVPSSDIKKFQHGHPATVWYYVGQEKIKYVYQLKVDDMLQLDIDTANQTVEPFNERVKKWNAIVRITWNLLSLVIWTFVYTIKYRKWLSTEK